MEFDTDSACNACGRSTYDTGTLIEKNGSLVCWDCLVKITRQEQRLFVSGTDLLNDEARIDWLVKGLIESDSIGQLFGPSGGGKSFVALDLSLCIASGQNWNDRPVKRGVVLYLSGEGRTGMKRRFKAWHKINSINLSCFQLSQHTVPFDETALSKIMKSGKEIELTTGEDVRLIVVDTLARHLCGDENSTREMGEFISTCEDIRSQFPGSTLLIVHHTGNSEEAKTRSRGSSALKAAMDFEINCDKGLLTFTKMKDALQPEPLPFLLRPVPIGFDEEGEEIVSCVVEYGERSQRHVMAELTPNERMLLELIKGDQDILIGDLRQLFYAKRREKEPDVKLATLKKAFSRAWEGISAKGFADLRDNTVIGDKGQMGDNLQCLPVRGTGGHWGTPLRGGVPMSPVSCPLTDPLADLDQFIAPEVVT